MRSSRRLVFVFFLFLSDPMSLPLVWIFLSLCLTFRLFCILFYSPVSFMSYIVLWEWFHPARVRNLQEPQAASCGIMWAMASCEKAQHTVQSSCPMWKRRFVFSHVNGLVIQKFSTVCSNFLFTVLQTLIKAPFSLSKRFLYNIHTLMNTSRATTLSASYPWLLCHTDWGNKGSKHQSSDQ